MAIKTANGDGSLENTLASKLDLAGGKILQIVRATDSTRRSTSNITFTDVTGMSVSITPEKSDSAIIVIATFLAQAEDGTVGINFVRFRLADSSDNPLAGADNILFGDAGSQLNSPLSLWGYSTPATTSSVTYKLQFSANSSGRICVIENDETTGQMYAIEVSA